MREAKTHPADEYPAVPLPTARLTGRALGLDIGGTGIKAAVVDLATGRLVTDRVRELTPQPPTPKAVLDVVASVVRSLQATGKLTPDMSGGAGFPSVIRAGRAMTATHGDSSWLDTDVQETLSKRLHRPIAVLNDADAAGWPRSPTAPPKGSTALSCCSTSAPASAPHCSRTGNSCRTCSWDTWSCTVATRNYACRPRRATQDRLEAMGRRVQRTAGPLRGVHLAGPHHHWRGHGQGLPEVRAAPQDEGATRRGGDGRHRGHRRGGAGGRESQSRFDSLGPPGRPRPCAVEPSRRVVAPRRPEGDQRVSAMASVWGALRHGGPGQEDCRTWPRRPRAPAGRPWSGHSRRSTRAAPATRFRPATGVGWRHRVPVILACATNLA